MKDPLVQMIYAENVIRNMHVLFYFSTKRLHTSTQPGSQHNPPEPYLPVQTCYRKKFNTMRSQYNQSIVRNIN